MFYMSGNTGAGSGGSAQLIQAMMQADFYSASSAQVQTSETLTSWLLLVGDLVYKIKKPVHFSFMEAVTPAQRYRLCCDEVALNSRLAAQVYVGVAGIAERAGKYILLTNIDGQRNLRDFAVVMHRLPAERMLNRMVADGRVSSLEIQQLVGKLAEFHSRASVAKSKVWGSAAAISRLMNGRLDEAERLAADTLTRAQVGAARKYLRGYILTHQQLLDTRARDGHIREAHGDLRCDSVCFAPAALAIIDCVEYNESFRYGDVASDVGSLALDLEMLRRRDLARDLVNAYIAASDDQELPHLLQFYKCYRAVLHGYLEALISIQPGIPLERRMLARHNASRAFAMAERLATAGDEDMLS